MADAALELEYKVEKITESISHQMESRGTRATNELMNAKNLVLRGQRSGRRYRVPNTKTYYTASAPGEPPAQRTGQFRAKWDMKSYSTGSADSKEVHSEIESNVRTAGGKYVLGQILEEGTPGGKIKPRPYQEKIVDTAKKNIVKIFEEPYL